MQVNSKYCTSDLALVATISLYYPIDSIDKSNPERVIFKFIKDDKFDSLLDQYWDGKLRIDPLRYSLNLKALKNRIFQ